MNRNFSTVCAVFLSLTLIFIVIYELIPIRTIDSFADTEKVVYLTFDDGPSDRVTPKILDILKEEDVKATFFVIGCNAEIRPYLLKRQVEEGHAIGVHSYSHIYKEIYASPEKLLDDIDKCNDVIEAATGFRSNIYRFPGGSHKLDKSLIDAVVGQGFKFYDWNVSTRDAELFQPSADDLFRSTVAASKDKSEIILLGHDSTDRLTTVYALKSIIKFYKDRDYTFATL